MTRIILKKGEEDRHLNGHPWVFDNEIEAIICGNEKTQSIDLKKLQCGEIADVETCRKKYIGRAFVNPKSKIVARLYSTSKEGVDEGFFRRRIRDAISLRTKHNLNNECARLIFAEADFLPGLIIDQYIGWDAKYLDDIDFSKPITFQNLENKLISAQKWLCIQFLSYAMDIRKSEIINALEYVLQNNAAMQDNMPIQGIIEKSAVPSREYEGLPLFEGVIKGTYPQNGIVVFENGFPFIVDLIGGQKTGLFLDQKENHFLCGQYAKEAGQLLNRSSASSVSHSVQSKKLKVLDTFCYSGGFSINVCKNCDAEVTAVDSSASALEALRQNARLNNVWSSIKIVEENVFDALTRYERAKELFDIIILDPPAFAKSRSVLEGALRGYKEINLKAIKLLRHGGILVTCSCSYAITEEKFKSIIAAAAFDADKRLVQLDFRYQSSDHTILVGYDESKYLKCGYYRVV